MRNTQDISDPVIRGAFAAMQRAAEDARRIAILPPVVEPDPQAGQETEA